MSLTPNAISQMFRMGGSVDQPSFAPTIQVIHVKKIDNKGGGGDERFKVSFMLFICVVFGCVYGCMVWLNLETFGGCTVI